MGLSEESSITALGVRFRVTAFVTRRLGGSAGESTSMGSKGVERHTAAALVKVVTTFSGIGFALLPLRSGGFLGAFESRSLSGGIPGDEEEKVV